MTSTTLAYLVHRSCALPVVLACSLAAVLCGCGEAAPPVAESTRVVEQAAPAVERRSWLLPYALDWSSAVASSTHFVAVAGHGKALLYTRHWNPVEDPVFGGPQYLPGVPLDPVDLLDIVDSTEWWPSDWFGHDLEIAQVYGAPIPVRSIDIGADVVLAPLPAHRVYVADPYAWHRTLGPTGAVYVFLVERDDNGTLSVEHVETIGEEEPNAWFGWDIDVESYDHLVGTTVVPGTRDNLVVGAPGARRARGRVWQYDVARDSGTATLVQAHDAPDDAIRFGRAVAVLSNGEDLFALAASAELEAWRRTTQPVVYARMLATDLNWVSFATDTRCLSTTPLDEWRADEVDSCFGRGIELVRNPAYVESRAVLLATEPEKEGLFHIWSEKEDGFAGATMRVATPPWATDEERAGCRTWGTEVDAINAYGPQDANGGRASLVLGIVSGYDCASGQRAATFKSMDGRRQRLQLTFVDFPDENGEQTSAEGDISVDYTGYWLTPDFGPLLGFRSHFPIVD